MPQPTNATAQVDLHPTLHGFHYNVLAFGAIGNGVANDQAAIQAAVDAANAAGGGIVHLPLGTYLVNTAVILKSNVVMQGCGSGTVIRITSGVNTGALSMTIPGTPTSKTAYSNITIRDLKLSSANQVPCRLRNTTRLRVRDVEVSVDSSATRWESLLIEYCDDVLVTGCYVHDVPGNGIQVNACDHASVIGNTIRNAVDDAIDIDCDFLAGTPSVKSRWVTVVGNVVDTVTAGNGIRVEDSDYVSVSGNVVNAAGSAGVFVCSTTGFTTNHVSVTGNVFRSCLAYGIRVGADNGGTLVGCVATGNMVSDCGNAVSGVWGGIVVHAGAPGTLVVGNRIHSCGNSAGADSGGIVLYKVNDISVNSNEITDCTNLGLNVWNGDAATTYTNTYIVDNIFKSNGTNFGGGAQDQAGVFRRDNRGDTNPGVSAITVTASPFTYTAGNRPEAVYIRGGTVSVIAKNSTTIFVASPATVYLEPGEAVTVTYSSAPTMTKDRK